MKSENLVYIKLGYHEAVQARKDILKTQMNAIKVAQALKRYKELRVAEMELKELLNKKAREFDADARKVKTLLPKLKIPKILEEEEEVIKKPIKTITLKEAVEQNKKKAHEAKKSKKEEVKAKPKHDDSFEAQLKEIQERLNTLEKD